MSQADRPFGNRRRFLGATGGMAAATMAALAAGLGRSGRMFAAEPPALPIADAHSHIGLISSYVPRVSLKEQMAAAGVMLLSWSIVGDGRWIAGTSSGIVQRSTPANGEQTRYLRQKLGEMRRYLDSVGLAHARDPSDIDAARGGEPRVVIALEGAGFADDGIDTLEQLYTDGLRHLQLVHYIRNGLGDFQTEAPQHDGLTDLGANVIRMCNRLGILVDLAHATNPAIDKALEVSTVPIIWSHSAITTTQYTWRQNGGLARRLYIDYAKKIAQRGGAVGLWSLKSGLFRDVEGYAGELMRMVDAIGPEHVMFGTDLDGVGKGAGMLDDLGDLRKVADALLKRGMDEKTLKAVCFENYARCLRAAMAARQA